MSPLQSETRSILHCRHDICEYRKPFQAWLLVGLHFPGRLERKPKSFRLDSDAGFHRRQNVPLLVGKLPANANPNTVNCPRKCAIQSPKSQNNNSFN